MNNWSQQARDTYLIQQDIEKPLTVDAGIWLSVFDINPLPMTPDWHGTVQFLWSDMTEMNHHFMRIPRLFHLTWKIAVTVCFDLLTPNETTYWGTEAVGLAAFNLTDYPAKLIGYDVADRFLTSGLLSFPYPENTYPEIKKIWGEHLNKYHLFDDEAIANDFRQLANVRSEGHSPFFVYGLYFISRSDDSGEYLTI